MGSSKLFWAEEAQGSLGLVHPSIKHQTRIEVNMERVTYMIEYITQSPSG